MISFSNFKGAILCHQRFDYAKLTETAIQLFCMWSCWTYYSNVLAHSFQEKQMVHDLEI